MEESVYYQTEVIQCPVGVKDWNKFVVSSTNSESGFLWSNDEEMRMVNDFGNDAVHIGTKWLLQLLASCGLEVLHLLKIINLGTHATHFLAILPDNLYACDCCMALSFHVGLIRARWYQDQSLGVTSVPAISLDNVARGTSLHSQPPSSLMNFSNPLDSSAPHLRPGSFPTKTLNARDVYHEAQEALKPLLNGVMTQEDLDDLKEELSELRYMSLSVNPFPGWFKLQHTRKVDLARHGSQVLSRADFGEEDLQEPCHTSVKQHLLQVKQYALLHHPANSPQLQLHVLTNLWQVRGPHVNVVFVVVQGTHKQPVIGFISDI
ncbi:hypothetical protein DFH29DRAFT_1039704 [Suillus ampliporus]|nr:hypothetical protein DFH29DRAFT_1039704 [Suillus ampliporus]